MQVLLALLVCSFLVPVLSTRDHSQALARIREARARFHAHRASRIKPQPPTPNPPRRPKRQDPVLLHICPVEDDLQSARSNGLLDRAFDQFDETRRMLEARTDGQPRDADAHFHHSHVHHALTPVQPTYLAPGLNLNINQNQEVHPWVNQEVHSGHSVHPLINQGVAKVYPGHSTVIAQQNQPVFHAKEAEARKYGLAGFPQYDHGSNYGKPNIDLNPDSIRESENPFIFPVERESTFDPFNQRNEVMDFLEGLHQNLDDLREADPTHKHHNHKHQPYPQNYGKYREADDVADEADGLVEDQEQEEREANPHKTHKLKNKHRPQQYMLYPLYSSYPQNYYNQYRESENGLDMSSDMRVATSRHHHHHKHKPKHKGPTDYYREAEEEEMPENTLAQPNLLVVPPRRHVQRSVDNLNFILGTQRQVVNSIDAKSKHDEDLKLVADISNRTLTTVENQAKKISKRSIPLTRLISDPNVRLDVPRTIENFGTATRNSLEDENAPLYHLKHLMVSSKDALLSAMRIPPQNMILPSNYEIVKSEDIVTRTRASDAPEDAMGFSKTFRRVGDMVRESVKSGQETAAHISDIAHDARNILHSSRHSAPRLILPYSHIPALQSTRSRTPSKAIFITPRILDLAQERLDKPARDSNLVRLGHLMDAVGLSNPNSKDLGLQKIIFEPRRPAFDIDDVVQTVNTLEDAKTSVGAKNLRDLLVKMKHELAPKSDSSKLKTKKKQQETKEMGVFIETLFDGSDEPKNETVGSELFLAPELMHPFMGRASKQELRNFLKDSGDDQRNESPKERYQEPHDHSEVGYVLGAINPLMFERMFNETLKVKDEEIDVKPRSEDEESVGTSMTMHTHMLKPFMGHAPPDQIQDLLETYNGTPNEDYIELDE